MSIPAEHGLTYEFTLKDRLRVAREEAGYTAAQFADIIGVSRNTIGNYEAGRTRVPRSAILLWAFATGFDREWLENGSNAGPAGGHARTGVCSRAAA